MRPSEILQYKGNLNWFNESVLLLTKHGSQAYGTNTPTSDLDIKGICIPPLKYFLGFQYKFEQMEMKDPYDTVVYDIRKFFSLAADNNPNIIEVLWTDPVDHLYMHPLMEMVLDNRDLFLSKKAKHTFSGYAVSQLKRIQTHYRWLKNPPTSPPTREELGLPERTVVPKDQLQAAESAIEKLYLKWVNFDSIMDKLTEDEKIQLKADVASLLVSNKISEEDIRRHAGITLGYDSNFLLLLEKERLYTTKRREWEQFQNWKATRNATRSALEEKFGYDCYLDDTEFLTERGWLLYTEIDDTDRLATINRSSGRLEFQHYSERVCKSFTGKIAFLTNRLMNCAVTLNHRMLLSPCHRNKNNGFSTEFNTDKADWQITPLQQILENRRTYYHARIAASPCENEFPISDDFLILMGCYISEGCIGKRLNNGKASIIRISQKVGGRIAPFMDSLMERHKEIRRFVYSRKEEWRTSVCDEITWTVAKPLWAERLDEECGSFSKNKRLPPWVLQLSGRQAKLLISIMVSGDGTEREYSDIYYTSSKKLADDMQALCVSAGIASQVWGPYSYQDETPMYQVYIGKQGEITSLFLSEKGHLRVENVNERKIVCFTVPNEILVTRRNGKVAIQGNTKHAMHLVRLMRMCREILTGKGVVVKRPDAAELLEIRNGAWKYEDLIKWAEAQDMELEELAKTSSLPKMPDRDRLDAICMSVVDCFLNV